MKKKMTLILIKYLKDALLVCVQNKR
jgi:hypothetical protein